MMNNTVIIDENSIYKAVYEGIKDITDWCYDKDITGMEVGNYIDGIVTIASALLKQIEVNGETKDDKQN